MRQRSQHGNKNKKSAGIYDKYNKLLI